MTWEGGVREPFIARFPGRIPKGLVQRGVAGTVDILPTLAVLCGARKPEKPLDGLDIWPLMTGKKTEVERELLLYFDDWNIQCARWGKWKLHVARYNNVTYSPPPPGGRMNLPLTKPELYDIESDVDESYDCAAEHPDVVREMQSRLDRMLATFPEEVQKAWAATKDRQVAPTPAGAVPRMQPAQ